MWWSLEALPQVMPAAWRRRCLCCLLSSGIYSTLVSEIYLLFHAIFFNLPDFMLTTGYCHSCQSRGSYPPTQWLSDDVVALCAHAIVFNRKAASVFLQRWSPLHSPGDNKLSQVICQTGMWLHLFAANKYGITMLYILINFNRTKGSSPRVAYIWSGQVVRWVIYKWLLRRGVGHVVTVVRRYIK
jgi:hypothetical protein